MSKGQAQWQERGRQQMEKEKGKRERRTRVLQCHATRVTRQDKARAMHQGGAMREEGATRHNRNDAWQRRGKATRAMHGKGRARRQGQRMANA